jgi:polysaccharide pyruvyl transferase WcaK-like protein
MRFHALVAAAAGGTRVVAVDHEPKLGALAHRLGQMSQRPHGDVAWGAVLSETLQRALPDPAAVAEQAALAAESFRLLRLVLGGGETPEAGQLTGLPLEPGFEQTA